MNEIKAILQEHNYYILEKIGEGGYAVVYKVYYPSYPDRPFVAKVMKIDSNSSDRINSYLGEIQVLKVLDHPNIIQIYNHFTTDEYFIIIIEYCPRGTLSDHVKASGVYSNSEFITVARQCIQALNACHCQNVAHRDIKPSNIMLDENQRVKLCDFGISSQQDTAMIERFDGSLPFVSPEIIQRKPYDPKKADIWALGITFYYLVVGKLPWYYRSREELINQILVGNPSYPGKVSTKIKTLISSMINKSPDRRITTEALLADPMFEMPKVSITKVFSGVNFGVGVKSPRSLNSNTCKMQNLKSFQFTAHRVLYTCPKDKEMRNRRYHSGSDG